VKRTGKLLLFYTVQPSLETPSLEQKTVGRYCGTGERDVLPSDGEENKC